MRYFVLLTLLCFGCKANPPTNPVDNGIDAGAGTDCERACVILVALGCATEKTARGATCAVVCENVESSGVSTWDPRCVHSDKRIVDCDDVNRYCRTE